MADGRANFMGRSSVRVGAARVNFLGSAGGGRPRHRRSCLRPFEGRVKNRHGNGAPKKKPMTDVIGKTLFGRLTVHANRFKETVKK